MAGRREQVDTLARDLGAEPPSASSAAWAVRLRDGQRRGPLWLRQRRHHVVVHAGDEVLVVRPRRRRPLEPEDLVARLPVRPGTLRRRRNLVLLHQLVIDDPGGGTVVLELPLRSRRLARSLAEALA